MTAVAGKDRLYRALDKAIDTRKLSAALASGGRIVSGAQFDLLLYDFPSTYFEVRLARFRLRSTVTAVSPTRCVGRSFWGMVVTEEGFRVPPIVLRQASGCHTL